METIGILAFILVLCNLGLPGKVKSLKADIKTLKHRIKEDTIMSEILKELEGKRCRLTLENSFSGPIECDVMSVDDEWMKIIHYEKKDKTITKIIKIEQICEVSLV
jgi:hypothetical protein